MSELAPRLWSDFDGTAVQLAKKSQPRNWAKYPLPIMEGYIDFLRGVKSKQIDIAGVASRRPNIYLRRLAMVKSIQHLGMMEFFPRGDQLALAGSEKAKGGFIAEQSRRSIVGMLEDKPHELGKSLIRAIGSSAGHSVGFRHPILLGVVEHERIQEYIEELAETAGSERVELPASINSGGEPSDGFSVVSGNLNLHVVQLQPYSIEAGKDFGQKLLKLTA